MIARKSDRTNTVLAAVAGAAGVTVTTKAIAMTVSQTDGTVRVWRAGKMVASFEPSNR